jgi:hypothetical protein
LILSRRFYSFLGETGVHTRKAGLDRETEKELLMKHLNTAGAAGAPMAELIQVLPGKSRDHIKRLLEQLRDAGRAHVTGAKRTARWHPGPAPSQLEALGGEWPRMHCASAAPLAKLLIRLILYWAEN